MISFRQSKVLNSCLALFGWCKLVHGLSAPVFSTAVKTTPERTKKAIVNHHDGLSTSDIRRLQQEQEQDAQKTFDADTWNALFVSVPERPVPTPCKEPTRKLPSDFPPGCLLRLGPNGGPSTDGFLDGDGMVQCITFPPESRREDYNYMFSSTYVETNGRKLEAKNSQNKRFEGSLGGAPKGFPLITSLIRNAITFQTLQAQKDTCNTALAEHGGRILACMEQCPPSEIRVNRDGSVDTVECMSRLDGAVPVNDPITGGSFSAHGRTCPDTRERIQVSYCSSSAPFVRVDIFDETNSGDSGHRRGWNLKRSMGVNIPAPVMVHDSVISENFVVVLDFPLTIRPSRMLFDSFPVEYEPKHGARIGLVPRKTGDTMWFECEPAVILHAVNAYETSENKVVLHALRSEPNEEESYLSQYSQPYLYEWVMDTITGELVSEGCLNAQCLVDFPVVDPRFVGKESMEAFYTLNIGAIGGTLEHYTAPREGCLYNGYTKLALRDDNKNQSRKGDVLDRYILPDSWYPVSEPTIVPKQNRDGKAKPGSYLVCIESYVPKNTPSPEEIAEGGALKSRVSILDADHLGAGPIWSLELPYHVPYGLHSCFLEWENMQ